MRRLIPLLLAGCVSDPTVEVSFELPGDAPPLDDESVRITIGEVQSGAFRTVVGAGGRAVDGVFAIEVPEGADRRARVLIHRGDFAAVFHGLSDPFDVEPTGEPIAVKVPLVLPPDGSIVRTTVEGAAVTLEMLARRWSSVRIGRLPNRPMFEGERPGEEPESDALEAISVDIPLEMIECTLESGCPLTLFAEFVAADGVVGTTATATLTVDVMPPALRTRARVDGADALGSGSSLIVGVEAGEPIAGVTLALSRTILRDGACGEELGPFPCAGQDRNFSCVVEAPEDRCDASYTISVTATDLIGNLSEVSGAEIAIDNIPPEVTVSRVECASGILVASGSTRDATRVVLEDAAGAVLASMEGGTFALAGSSSIAASVVAIDGGGNGMATAVSCP
jgi:hypothetical protein